MQRRQRATFWILIVVSVCALLYIYIGGQTFYKQNRQTTPQSPHRLLWGAFVGEGKDALQKFEALVGKKTDIVAIFLDWDTTFPSSATATIGSEKKTLLIFWEPTFGYDEILTGTYDNYLKQFAADAKTYGYPVLLVPFAEMNLNQEAWGYNKNGNTAQKFVAAWKHVHGFFANAKNVRFGLAYNNTSIPDTKDNAMTNYYPGSEYVDYVGVDGFNFNEENESPTQLFDPIMQELERYHKPIYIFSTGAVAQNDKAAWITAFGEHIKNYKALQGWLWFNSNGRDGNWLVDSDPSSLQAFQHIVP